MDYKDQLDKALEENIRLQSTLGIDSTKKEVLDVKRKQYQNLLFLKDINKEHFDRLAYNFDRKFRKFEESD